MTTPSTARKAGPYLGTGAQTAWPFAFKVFAASDIQVMTANAAGDETLLVLGTDYSVSLNANQDTSPGGTVTYPISGSALPSGSVLAIVGNLPYDQPLDLPSGGNFSPLAIENQLDRTTMQIQQLREEMDRTAKLPPTSSESVEDLVDDLQRLADSADNIDTVAENITSVNVVAADLSEPVSEVNTVATSIANVNAVGNSINNVNTVAGIAANVTTVAGIAANVTTVAGISANVTTVAGIAANINAVAANETNIDAVVGNATNINAVGNNISNVNTVAGISTNVTTVAGISADVSTVADNLADVTNFADVYQGPKAADPTLRNNGNALQAGDLYFNTADNALRAYSGSQWVAGTAGTINVQRFSGDGSGTTFTLASAPAGENNTQVYISGVYQQKDQYSLSGSTLTFASAPPSGADNVEVVTIATLALGETDASLVSFLPAGTGAVATTVQNKLREFVSVKDYGAVGDGVNDDTTAIQTAINANPGRVIFFPRGFYTLFGTVTVSSDGTVLEGGGPGVCSVSQRTPDVDTFLFKPTTAGVTSAFLNGPAIRGMNISHSSVIAASTQGAGVNFLQCNGYRLFNVSVNNAPGGITIQGGQFGSLKSFQVFASSGSLLSDSALLWFKEAPYGSGQYQPCYTTQIEDFRLSASKLRTTLIWIESADGLSFAQGYLAFGATSLLRIKPARDNVGLSAMSFLSTYFDCVGAGHTPYGVEIPDTGFANAYVNTISIGSGCFIGNGDEIGILVRNRNTRYLAVEGSSIANMGKWAIDVEGSAAQTTVQLVGNRVTNNGDGTTGVIRAETGRNLIVSGNIFGANELKLLRIQNTWNHATITGNSNDSNIRDIDDSGATYTYGCAVGMNASRYSGSGSWKGQIQLSNNDNTDPLALDWYQEGTFTPTLTIGGSSAGITYSTQVGSYTRIGNRVFYSLRVVLSSKGTGTGEVNITGLPFAATDVAITYPAPIRMNNVQGDLGASNVIGDMFGTGTAMRILYMNTAGATEIQTPVTDGMLTDTTNFLVNGSYRCA